MLGEELLARWSFSPLTGMPPVYPVAMREGAVRAVCERNTDVTKRDALVSSQQAHPVVHSLAYVHATPDICRAENALCPTSHLKKEPKLCQGMKRWWSR